MMMPINDKIHGLIPIHMKNKTNLFLFAAIVSSLICKIHSNAETITPENSKVNNVIEMKKVSKNGISIFTFHQDGKCFYRLACKKNSIQRTFVVKSGTNSDVRVTEYDLDYDGNIDGIQIGENDENFTPYLVLFENETIDIELLPKNWRDSSEFEFDAFMNYLKKRKNIK